MVLMSGSAVGEAAPPAVVNGGPAWYGFIRRDLALLRWLLKLPSTYEYLR